MTILTPASFYRTGSTTIRPSGGFASTIRAMSLKFSRGHKFSTVDFFVASDTKGYAIGYIQSEIEIVGKRFYVMGMNFYTRLTTILACVIIALVNGIAPLGKIALRLSAFANKRFPAFPYWGRFSCAPFQNAFIGTKRITMIDCVKLISACTAYFIKWLTPFRPAIFGAIMSRFGSVRFHLKWRPAKYTVFCYLSIFHKLNYTTLHLLSPAYVAVALQRWADLTGRTPELIGTAE
jgi:hypothetical protein